jgi:signal transduction histidine kinase
MAPGPAQTTLRAAATRTASIIRCVGIIAALAQVIIWHSYYLAVPWRLAGPAVAVAWGLAAMARLLRRWPTWQFAALDSGFYVLLALCAQWYLPPVLRGDSANWVYIMVLGQLVAPAWFTPSAVLAVLTLASVTAYWAGAVITPADGSASASPVTACVLLLAVATAAWVGRRMLYRRAITADTALVRADQEAAEQYVLLTRHTERREHERLLHDTVLNTLTALARGGGSAGDVVSRCGQDVRLIEAALAGPDEAAGAAWPYGGLLTMIEAAAAQMRARGLEVHVAVEGEAAARYPATAGMPAKVARALAHAVREALANVASHAGTSEARVDVSPGDDELLITVRDAGAGFDPGQVTPGRLGLRRSIVERVHEHGGQAVIRSAPGEGTEVSLRWAPQPPPSGGGMADAGVGGVSGSGDARW